MTISEQSQHWLAALEITDDVLALRPDYRVLVTVAEGLQPGPSDEGSDALLSAAEEQARTALGQGPVEEQPHLAAWREAYRAFGAKPQRTRPSVEALVRRLDPGLPRVDRITDVYNALSVSCLLPLGGEDLATYDGPARLVRARGDETFETTGSGQAVREHPSPGEVVWRDDAGVTYRRWNWRQCTRTRITETTTSAVFILDALAPCGAAGLDRAGAALLEALASLHPAIATTTRRLGG